jgi:hypothetical protein
LAARHQELDTAIGQFANCRVSRFVCGNVLRNGQTGEQTRRQQNRRSAFGQRALRPTFRVQRCGQVHGSFFLEKYGIVV